MNNKYPLISVITPCFNDGRYLLECIESVCRSDYNNIEHIIIDDGSTDKYTCKILDSLNTQNLRLIRTQNQGVCKARNEAILASSGKYILPLDADDLISKKYISLGVRELEEDPSITLVVPTNYKYFGRRNKIINIESYSFDKLLGHNFFPNSSMFRRLDFDKVGGYNENMKEGLEDWELWINLLKHGGKVKYIDGIHYYYRLKRKSYSRNASIDDKMHCSLRKQIYENHKELFSEYFFNPLYSFEYQGVINSREYRLGRFLLLPVRKILNILENISR